MGSGITLRVLQWSATQRFTFRTLSASHRAFLYCRARWYCHNYDVVSPRSRVKMQ